MWLGKYQADGDPRTSGPGFGLTVHPDALRLPYDVGRASARPGCLRSRTASTGRLTCGSASQSRTPRRCPAWTTFGLFPLRSASCHASR